MNEKLSPTPYFPLQAAIFEAGLAIMAMLLGWTFGQSPMETLRVSPAAVARGVLAVLPLLGMLVICERVSWRPVLAVRRALDDLILPMFRNCNWIEIAAIALLAGVGEELLFRGLFQTAIVDWSADFLPHTPSWAVAGDWMAIVGAAIIFGMLHAVNAAYAVLAAIMGLYLGWLWMATGNLTEPIIAHGLYDFLALMYLLHKRP